LWRLGVAREKGLKGIVTAQGAEARSLARRLNPVAITLDIFLPDMQGWTVLNHLKQDPATRHIPVQILTVEEDRLQGLGHGAFSYLIKPAEAQELGKALENVLDFARSPAKRLLIIEADERERRSLAELLRDDHVEIVSVGTGSEARQALGARHFDCAVLDLGLADTSGFELLEKIAREPDLDSLPIVVFTGRDFSEEEDLRLLELAELALLKRVQSPERLLDEVSLFLHLMIAQMAPAKQQMLERVRQSDQALAGRRVLVVDDDVRNIFALTGLLEQRGMQVITAETGREAIALLESEDMDAVLMDIMMPEMDGYETIRLVRKNPRHRLLPILALTAKAMKGDREKCLEAGAFDYIAKPVNPEELLVLLRTWLFGKPRTKRLDPTGMIGGGHGSARLPSEGA
jgi:CheY-like chemotaxis protein